MRVASVPHGHVYVEHLSNPDGPDGVVRLPDPPPENPALGSPWWPPVMLDKDWINEHADEFDLYHLHFGFDSVEPGDLEDIVDALRSHGKPFIYTVHDLRDPYQLDRRTHDAALDILVPAADDLITLTNGAADEIEQRWGRRPHVIPHPHVIRLDEMGRERPVHRRPNVGLHMKTMRPDFDPLPVARIVLEEMEHRDLDFTIDVHRAVLEPNPYYYDEDIVDFLHSVRGRERVHVDVHDFYNEEQLRDYVIGVDLSILPYRFATHSGWLEACYDLGTRVLAPELGHYREQHDGVLAYGLDDSGPDRADIAAALDSLSDPTPWRADPDERLIQRREIAAAHRRVYAEAWYNTRA